MKVLQVLNNNVVVSQEGSKEVILMGRGLGFQTSIGDNIKTLKIEKKFYLEENALFSKYIEFISDINSEHLMFFTDLIEYIENKLSIELNNVTRFSMIDHFNSLEERFKLGLYLPNTLLYDVKRFYKNEFFLSREIVEKLNLYFGSQFDDNEAATITLHIVNSLVHTDKNEIMKITGSISDILKIVKYELDVMYEEDSLEYIRFVTHLKYFLSRVMNGKPTLENYDINQDLYVFLVNKYPEINECIVMIEKYLLQNYNYNISQDEVVYLIVHINKVI